MCHQTVCLVARHLEEHGIPTIMLGSALDIMQAGRPPRGVYLDYPLGHSAGKPHDPDDQAQVVDAALGHLHAIKTPGEIVTLPNQWSEDGWRKEASSTEAVDTRQPRDETPQFQHEEDRLAAASA